MIPPNKPAIHILLVEDDPADVLLTKKTLLAEGSQVSLSVASNGEEALDLLNRKGSFSASPRPDLIMLDLNMPKMDGREFLAEIKLNTQLKRIPIIVLTTSDAPKDIIDSYQLQASCYVTKPLNLEEYSRVLRSIREFWLHAVTYVDNM